MTTRITSQTLNDFLSRLGRCYRHPGKVFLVGGSSLILVAAKTNTFDIDLQFEVQPKHHTAFIRCLRQLSRQLKLPIEQASPEQFMPLPKGYQDRHQFIGRYGLLDVFHFDFYSIALSKIHRGNEKDFVDVMQMVRKSVIELPQLKQYYEEILPELEGMLQSDPDDFADKFALFKKRLEEELS